MTEHLASGDEKFVPAGSGLAATTLVHEQAELSGGQPPDQPEREFTVKARSQRQMVVRRFLHHRLAMICLGVLAFVVLLAFIGIHLWKYDFGRSGSLLNRGRPTLDVFPAFMDGDGVAIGEHPFGQDDIGRDYLALTLRGAQRSIIIAVTVGLIATTFGTLIGALAGFYRGRVDGVLMRFVDVGLTIPLLLVAAVLNRADIPFVTGFFGENSIFFLAIVIASASWLDISRVIRSEFLSLREKEYVEAARALGTTNRRIIVKHILPNVAGTIIVTATLLISAAILVETALSFLGFGVSGTDTSLGKLVTDNQNASMTRPWLFYWPGVFIIVIALCINFIGDGLRDAFDPKQTRVRA